MKVPVAFGVTETEPTAVLVVRARLFPLTVVVLSVPPIIQESIVGDPRMILEEEAEKDVIERVAVGVTLPLGELDAEVPTPFVAVTTKVYAVPLLRPDTVIGLPDEVALNPPLFAVAV